MFALSVSRNLAALGYNDGLPSHTVVQGEHLARIALRYGFRDWQSVYQHPKNAELRKRRPNPNVLLPGDEVFIPALDSKQVACSTGKTHVFRLNDTPHCVRIIVKDPDGKPYAGEQWEINVAGQIFKGKTDSTGLVYQEITKPTEEAELRLPELGLGWALKIGHLDPIFDKDKKTPIMTGVKARLKNLGFYEGDVDGDFDDETKDAVKRFQSSALNREEPDGELDDATRDALQQQHVS